VAVIQVTEVMHNRLIANPTVLSEPTFAVDDSLNNKWELRRPYLGVFVYQAARLPKRVVALGIAIPGKMDTEDYAEVSLKK
jgi:hypothetical protein